MLTIDDFALSKRAYMLVAGWKIRYTAVMRFLPKPQPMAAFRDVISVVRTPMPHKLGIAGVCAALTYLLIAAFVHDFTPAPVPRKTVIIYVKQWPKSRTLAQVRAQQDIDAPVAAAAQAKAAAEIQTEEAKRRAQFEHVHQVLKSYGIN